jgi:predicted nucleotide-binding protein
MSTNLPIRTTVDDIVILCVYLAAKPIGATVAEAKAVIDPGVLDGRKTNAMKFWGLIEDVEGRLKLTELGRSLAKEKGARKPEVLRKIITAVPPYRAIVERAFYREEPVITASETAAHWHDNFKGQVSDNEKILNDQAVCFFQVAQGADLGQLTIGRHSQPTRFEFHRDNVAAFIEGAALHGPPLKEDNTSVETPATEDNAKIVDLRPPGAPAAVSSITVNTRVFITHGKNKKILDQMKEIVSYGGYDPIVSVERESSAKPVPDKVMADMRTCGAAVIHVAIDNVLFDKEGNEVPQIYGNVLIEIGAAMALYGNKFVLLVEEGLKLPSNLQGLYECRYKGDELSGGATMKLLKAFNDFKSAA